MGAAGHVVHLNATHVDPLWVYASGFDNMTWVTGPKFCDNCA